MTAELLQRIRKEFTLTLTALHETLLAVSDRVNRKVHILKLHWQASSIAQQMEAIQQETGAFLAQQATQSSTSDQAADRQQNLRKVAAHLSDAAARARLLKNDLLKVDALVRELETETLTEDLVKIQEDLLTRSATIERVVVTQGSSACGQTVGQLALPPTVRIVVILRGPTLVTACETAPFRTGDAVVLLGLRNEVTQALHFFTDTQRAFA
ncbi:MAG: hypothetical protein FJ246_08195 [Nitrospira sp.]|nr:hypothetical protein [Nitrospira sp.]